MTYANNYNPSEDGSSDRPDQSKRSHRHAIISVLIVYGVLFLTGFVGLTLILKVIT